MDYLQAAITLLSLIAAILAWFAKLRWANEFKDAKEAQIQAIERELQTYKEFSPMKVREYLLSTKATLEEYNNELLNGLEIARKEISEKDKRIRQLGDRQQREKEKSLSDKQELSNKVTYLEGELNRIRPAYEQAVTISGSYNNFADNYLVDEEGKTVLIDYKDAIKSVRNNSEAFINYRDAIKSVAKEKSSATKKSESN